MIIKLDDIPVETMHNEKQKKDKTIIQDKQTRQ